MLNDRKAMPFDGWIFPDDPDDIEGSDFHITNRKYDPVHGFNIRISGNPNSVNYRPTAHQKLVGLRCGNRFRQIGMGFPKMGNVLPPALCPISIFRLCKNR